MPSKHVVASIWNMAANRVVVGVPETWVHPCYRLDTWKEVYSHHINPIKGKIMWPKSNIPTIILPLNHHPQVGRPPKKRKRSFKGPQVPKVNKTVATSRRGASASNVKGSASGSKATTQKGNKSSASVKVATSSSKAPQIGNKTVGSVKGVASGSKAAA
ncbi:hypothetical protein Tco_0337131 [Tanacetum coccineum]